MPLAPVAAGLQSIYGRTFAFYPPVANIAENEWYCSRTTWTEFMVVHLPTGAEFPIPLALLGDISFADRAPGVVVTLTRELELREGIIRPKPARVIELPVLVVDEPDGGEPRRAGQIVNIAPPSPTVSRWNAKTLSAAIVLGVIACATITGIVTQSHRVPTEPTDAWLQLGPGDDYASVVKKLGNPSRERSYGGHGRAVRLLFYPQMRFTVTLEGSNRADEHFTHAFDRSGRILKLPN